MQTASASVCTRCPRLPQASLWALRFWKFPYRSIIDVFQQLQWQESVAFYLLFLRFWGLSSGDVFRINSRCLLIFSDFYHHDRGHSSLRSYLFQLFPFQRTTFAIECLEKPYVWECLKVRVAWNTNTMNESFLLLFLIQLPLHPCTRLVIQDTFSEV